MARKTACLAFILVLVCQSGAHAESIELYLFVQNLEHAGPPVMQNGSVIFTYEAPTPVFIVAARFNHENYGKLHVFQKNDHSVFFLVLPAPRESMTLKYRLMVDGIWMSDPNNPSVEQDARGTPLSLLRYQRTAELPIESPKLLGNGEVEFTLQIPGASFVMIAGDFNAFDPFSDRVPETAPGTYRTRLKLFSGTHYYYFVVDGVPLIDPRNAATVINSIRQRLSVVVVP